MASRARRALLSRVIPGRLALGLCSGHHLGGRKRSGTESHRAEMRPVRGRVARPASVRRTASEERVMKAQWCRFGVGAILICLSLSSTVFAESLKEQIVGAWRLVSIYNEQNGAKQNLYGDKPVGLTIFDRSGYVIQYISKANVGKFAAENRLKGTDQEYRTVMQGMISGFGTYTVDGDTVTIKWVASSYPNRAGTTEKRTYKVVGQQMTSVNPTAASGGTSYTTFERAK